MDWAHEGDSHHLSSAFLLEFDSCEYIEIARFFSNAFRSRLQDNWSIGLGKETQEGERGSSENQANPKRPPPRNDGDKA